MHRLFLFSCVLCLAVARPQDGYNYGQHVGSFQPLPSAEQLQPLQQSFPTQLAATAGQIETLGQSPSLSTAPTSFFHESHPALASADTSSFDNELKSTPIQAQFTPETLQSALPQPQFEPLAISPSTADIAPSNIASQTSPPAVQLTVAPVHESQPAQPSASYRTAHFPDPITTTYKHIYGKCYLFL